jgi:nucleoside-diphosphate-sugar epimerase
MQFVYVKDLVELAIKVLDLRNVIGHSFNTANPRVISQHQLVLDLARAAGLSKPKIISLPRDFIQRAGGQAIGEKLYFGYYYDVPAITEVVTKAQRMLSFRPTDFAFGLKVTFEDYQKKRPSLRTDFSFEDDLLARAATHQPAPRSA